MAEKKTNDQGEIIEALKNKNYSKVWEKLKYVGYNDEKNIHRRYIIFKKACNDFNPYVNNNFILFYKKYINYLDFDKDSTFIATTNYGFIKDLKNENISPSDDRKSMVDQLSRINP